MEDFTAGIKRYGYWHNLAWNDIKTRYRRSFLGEFWMAINLAIFIASVGAVYAILLNARLSDYLPGLTIGYALWLLFSALMIEGCQTFIMGTHALHQQRVPLTALVLRNVDRAFIAFAHNFVVVVIILAICGEHLNFSTLLFIPGLVFWWLNGMWLSFVVGTVSARFRDIPQIVTNLVQILFLIFSIYGATIACRHYAWLASQFNPLTHFLAIVRNPLLGVDVPNISWGIVCVVTAVGWIAAALVIRSYRTRVSLWV